jgi:hypothetical protein
MLASTPSFAMFDIRGGFGTQNGIPKDVNDTFTGDTDIKSINGLTADVMFHLPLIGLGVGLRYEDMSTKTNDNLSGGSILDKKFSVQRTSAVVDYRLIDTLVYFGVIGTYGLAHTIKYYYDCNGGICSGFPNPFNGTAQSPSSYSLGVEAGLKVSHITLGAELGYQVMTASSFVDNGVYITNSDGSNVALNFSGVYYKLMLGVTF